MAVRSARLALAAALFTAPLGAALAEEAATPSPPPPVATQPETTAAPPAGVPDATRQPILPARRGCERQAIS